MRLRPSMLLSVLAVGMGSGAKANGTIDTTGAVLTVGTSAGTPGISTVDACAPGGSPPALPPLGSLGTIGAIEGMRPPMPPAGQGADGSFHATSNQTLPGGTYDF